MTMRRHLIEDLLATADDSSAVLPDVRYDATRHLSVLSNGQPVVEHAPVAGTVTGTKTLNEGEDTDAPMLGTTTRVANESTDTDFPAAWAGTTTGTRELGGDTDGDG